MEAPGYKLLSSSSGKGVVTFNGGVPTGSGFILKWKTTEHKSLYIQIILTEILFSWTGIKHY